MQLYPVLASEWVTFPQNNQEILKSIGAVPVNDVFWSLWNSYTKVKLLRGGRGGGKSEIIADIFVNRCLTESYFKGYYGKKVFETLRDTCFATLVSSIEKNGLQKYFRYSTSPNGHMVIDCVNGNRLVPFGSDKADKLKSIKDPTHIWCEEFDQFDEDDFKELYPTLRTTRGSNEFWASFNSYAVYESHWILKYFYPKLYTGDDKPDMDIVEDAGVLDVFANYTDNYFIDQDDYTQKLKLASGGNSTIFEGLANGAWGVTENKNPWLYAFDRARHVRPAAFRPTYPVYIFMDINNDPLECTIWQMSPNKGESDSFLHCIKEYSGKFKLEELALRIRTDFPISILFLGGDRSGQNEDVGRNQTVYQIMGSCLNLSERQLLLNTTNLEHADSRILCNALIQNYPNFAIDPSCVNLINQCEIATINDKSAKPHQLLKDRKRFKLDAFDSLRYCFQTLFHKWVKDTYLKVIKK